jgi:hypothetical protein
MALRATLDLRASATLSGQRYASEPAPHHAQCPNTDHTQTKIDCFDRL